MDDFKDKVAFITGGASGVGLGQAKVLAGLGAKVVLADIREDRIEQALDWFKGRGFAAHALRLDITDREAYTRAADETERVFGTVQLLFNTAGVSAFGPLEKSTYDDYDWMMGVNFGGVVNGIQTFVPRMIAHGKGGHIVNTASLGAFISSDAAGIYCASKFAVRGLSDALREALAKYNIGVSCLCPMNVNSNIAEATFTRPAALGKSGYAFDTEILNSLRTIYSQGMDPVVLAEHVVAAIRRNEAYIIPYPEARPALQASFDAVMKVLPPEGSDPEGVAKRQAAMARFIEERRAREKRS